MGEAGDVLSCVMAGGEGVVEERPGGAVLRVKNDTGEGSMAFCQVFDGVGLSFNDFRLDAYDSGFVAGPDMLCIDHCREGRIEQPVAGGAYSYVASGDLKIDDRSIPACSSAAGSLPRHHRVLRPRPRRALHRPSARRVPG